MTDEPIIAVGLLTSSDVERLGATFTRLWPIDQSTDFTDLLRAIDEADERLRQDPINGFPPAPPMQVR
jgi:hypothetical protein